MTEDEERDAINEAASMLLAGKVEGPLTVVRLAEVAGLKRWKLTHKHVDLMRAFQAETGAERSVIADTEAAEAALVAEKEKSRALASNIRRLESILERYAIVIGELTSELHEARKSKVSPTLTQDIPRIPKSNGE